MLMLIAILIAAGVAAPAAALIADCIATLVAVHHWARLERLTQALLSAGPRDRAIDGLDSWKVGRPQRRAMARHLQHTLRATAHFSLYPQAAASGYALARGLHLLG